MEINRKYLSPEAGDEGGYGLGDDEVKTSPFRFGGNFGVTKLKKFEWIPNAGKDGAEQEALDIIFDINGTDKSYRLFPVTKVFSKQNQELTDKDSAEYKEAKKLAVGNLNNVVTHILNALLPKETVQAGLSKPTKSFKEYTQNAASLLPKDFNTRLLDIFMQYQWNITEGQNRTYLELPKKMSYGAWLKPAIEGVWTEKRAENIQESTREALWYENEKGEKHPFTKNGWFMLSNFANQQRTAGTGDTTSAGAAMNAAPSAANTPVTPTTPPSTASSW